MLVVAAVVAFFPYYKEKQRRLLRAGWLILGFLGIGSSFV